MRAALLAVLLWGTASAAEPAATLQRAAMFVKDRPAVVAFYRDVLGYAEGVTTLGAGPYAAGNPWGLPAGAHIDLTYLKSADGAFMAVMSTDAALPELARAPGGGNAFSEIALVHTVTGLDAIHARAKAAGAVILQPPKLSASGKARQMFLRDPAGTRIELNEMLPAQ